MRVLRRNWLSGLIVILATIVLIATPGNFKAFAESEVSDANDRVQTIVVELNDDYFNPKNITIPNGTKTTLLLKNKGSKSHTFTVKMLNIDVELQPGKETSIGVQPKQANTYDLTCKYHFNVGMVGKVIVK
ncbi:cupredoxin domain-containing protein [Gottfriedia sp. NPDC058432]|uniref:cupredoxin domain-containing protein n=1 Tax=Gottfriedia sp. NPDC058432 TaxID=3346497 RepID=UPI0036615A2F